MGASGYSQHMTDELKSERVIVMMTPSELAALDEWWSAHRIGSRGDAIRLLVQVGLKASGERDNIRSGMEKESGSEAGAEAPVSETDAQGSISAEGQRAAGTPANK